MCMYPKIECSTYIIFVYFVYFVFVYTKYIDKLYLHYIDRYRHCIVLFLSQLYEYSVQFQCFERKHDYQKKLHSKLFRLKLNDTRHSEVTYVTHV